MKRLTREWVHKAEADYRAAARLHRGSDPLHDIVCFHCHQSAEKYLKVLLQELGLAVPRTHVLGNLLTPLLSHHPTLRSLRRGLVFLSDFAIDPRYPGRKSSKRQAASALRWAGQVRTATRALLGIRARRRGK